MTNIHSNELDSAFLLRTQEGVYLGNEAWKRIYACAYQVLNEGTVDVVPSGDARLEALEAAVTQHLIKRRAMPDGTYRYYAPNAAQIKTNVVKLFPKGLPLEYGFNKYGEYCCPICYVSSLEEHKNRHLVRCNCRKKCTS